MAKQMELLNITEGNRTAILEIFDLGIDNDGYIIDAKTKERIICQYSRETIRKDKLAIVAGSELKINNYAYCLSEYLTEYLDSKG